MKPEFPPGGFHWSLRHGPSAATDVRAWSLHGNPGVSGTSPGTWDLGRSVIFFRKEAGELQMMAQDACLCAGPPTHCTSAPQSRLSLPFLLLVVFHRMNRLYWVGQKVCSDFPITANEKTQTFWPTQYIEDYTQVQRTLCNLLHLCFPSV